MSKTFSVNGEQFEVDETDIKPNLEDYENMHQERRAAYAIVHKLGATDFIDTIIRLDKMLTLAMQDLEGTRLLRLDAEKSADNLAGILDMYRRQCLDIASQLSHAGDLTHKEKNDAILRVIARLIDLAVSNGRHTEKAAQDIPF